MIENDIKTNSIKAWILAVRPKTLTGCITPVLIGSALAWTYINDNDGFMEFKVVPFILCMLFAMLMQIDANFVNDYYDFVKGSDREDRLGPKRACAQGWVTLSAMRIAIGITTVLSCIAGLPLMFYGVWWQLLLVGVACVVFCFLYTYGLSYLGLGDVLVLVFFGIVPVCVTFYLQTGEFLWSVFAMSVACGLAIDCLLMINNYRDYEQDKISGKRTIVVRYGKKAGAYMYLGLGYLACFITIAAAGRILLGNIFGTVVFLIMQMVYVRLHNQTWKKMVSIEQGKQLNQILGMTARNIFIYGILVSIGLCIAVEWSTAIAFLL